MARLSRKLRVCKWVGTAGCALMVAAWAISTRRQVEYYAERPDGQVGVRCTVTLVRAQIQIRSWHFDLDASEWFPAIPYVTPCSHWSSTRIVMFTGPWMWRSGLDRPRLSVTPQWFKADQATHRNVELSLPLWLLLTLALPASGWLWWRDRSRRGFCRRCDYDLTGNVSGVCPECGSKIAGLSVLGGTG